MEYSADIASCPETVGEAEKSEGTSEHMSGKNLMYLTYLVLG